MVVGIDKFREHFAGHEDQYAIIGGAACELLFDAAGISFRATKDIDMVLCVGVVDAAFGESFSAFLKAGDYEVKQRSDGMKEFYRFIKPKDEAYPFMIELFSRKPEALNLEEDAKFTAIPVEEDVMSLSAILLDEGYYEVLQGAKRDMDGVTIIDETLLIPFKARAFLDLTERKEKGDKIDSKNIKKHRNDVFRLAQLLPEDASIELPAPIKEDMGRFLDLMGADETLKPNDFNVPLTRDEGVSLIRNAYGLTSE